MNLLNIAINGNTLGMLLLGIIAAMVMGITFFRFYLHRKQHQNFSKNAEASKPFKLSERNKYLPVNVFRYSGTFFNIGLVVALGVSVLAFGWTQFDPPVKVNIVWGEEFIDEVKIIPTKHEKKKELPPPPKKPEFVVVENTAQVDTVEFVDPSLKEFVRPEPVGPSKPAKIVLPPPKEKEDDVPPIFKVVEEMPRFPGCEDMSASKEDKKKCADTKLLQFVQSKIKYPAIARENGIQGRCFVSFVVEKDGSVSNVELIRDIGGQCGEEAMRVVNMMANSDLKWTPGKQRGRPVRVQFNLPVHFRLE